jgi:hypothetical protein
MLAKRPAESRVVGVSTILRFREVNGMLAFIRHEMETSP